MNGLGDGCGHERTRLSWRKVVHLLIWQAVIKLEYRNRDESQRGGDWPESREFYFDVKRFVRETDPSVSDQAGAVCKNVLEQRSGCLSLPLKHE